MIKDVITYPIGGRHDDITRRNTVVLKRSPDDPEQFSSEYQETIGNVLAASRADGVNTMPRIFTMDAVDAVGGYTGEFIAIAKSLGTC